MISRLKILACLDISERRTPQDGRFAVKLSSKKLDVRVSTLPANEGEKIVIRLLDSSPEKVDLTELGFSDRNARLFSNLVSEPQGMILVTGPTGSGKSTTLCAALNAVNSPKLNIVTVEDPVEFRINGVNHVQINPKIGLTFATALRAILRQDPNVILVGEVRDTETAEIALQAAQTGHMVLSSLHTNDAVSAITRLLDLKVPDFMISSSVSAIVAQRLVRKLCVCKMNVPARRDYTARLAGAGLTVGADTMWVPGGCSLCENTGYRGRVAIYELLPFTEAIRTAIRSGAQDQEISVLARSSGMKLLVEDGLEKVRQGLTTIEEITRVLGFSESRGQRCSSVPQRPMAAVG
jgi:type IV pilus assembly protein PilB